MLSEDIKLLSEKFDPLVEGKFREFLAVFVKRYRDNPTKKKLAHLLLNLPVGFLLNQDEVLSMLNSERALTQKELISTLKRLDEVLLRQESNEY